MGNPKEKEKNKNGNGNGNDAVVMPKDEVNQKKTPQECFEFPEDMPVEVQRTMMAMMSSSQQSGGNRAHPLFEKFTEDHVHKYLDYIQKDDDNEFSLRSTNRWFLLMYVVLGIGLFLFLVVYLLPKDKMIFDQIVKMFVAFAGGFGGGYGLKTYKGLKK